ncbi:MAG: hypothetical protein EXS05_23520 [Planctomycetaceae bacterium]|nr:hypothetical protein [Planctomycetaceae bacterium]
MWRLLALIGAAAIGAATVFAAFQFHFVRTSHRWLMVPKQSADWREAYVDVRGWTLKEWSTHPKLSGDLIAAGYGEFVSRSGAEGLFRGLFDSFRDRGADE